MIALQPTQVLHMVSQNAPFSSTKIGYSEAMAAVVVNPP